MFQLYSDKTVVQFPNLDLLPSIQRHGQLESLACQAYLDIGTRACNDVFNLLVIRGPTHGKGKPVIGPGSPDPQFSQLPLHHRCGLQKMDPYNTLIGIGQGHVPLFH